MGVSPMTANLTETQRAGTGGRRKAAAAVLRRVAKACGSWLWLHGQRVILAGFEEIDALTGEVRRRADHAKARRGRSSRGIKFTRVVFGLVIVWAVASLLLSGHPDNHVNAWIAGVLRDIAGTIDKPAP